MNITYRIAQNSITNKFRVERSYNYTAFDQFLGCVKWFPVSKMTYTTKDAAIIEYERVSKDADDSSNWGPPEY